MTRWQFCLCPYFFLLLGPGTAVLTGGAAVVRLPSLLVPLPTILVLPASCCSLFGLPLLLLLLSSQPLLYGYYWWRIFQNLQDLVKFLPLGYVSWCFSLLWKWKFILLLFNSYFETLKLECAITSHILVL